MDRTVTSATQGGSFTPVRRSTQASSLIAEQILERIRSGVLQVGSRLPSEEILAKELGVSRPTVREGLAALQFAGHVESRRGFGTVVVSREPATTGTASAPPLRSLSDAVELLETRLLVEPHAMAVAARDPEPKALKAARELIGGMHLAVNDPELHASTDIRVHRALLHVCRNSYLRDCALDLVDHSLDPLLSTARISAWTSPQLPHVWAEQHDSVCDAITSGDPVRAREASLAHLASVVENLAAATRSHPELQQKMEGLFRQVPTARAVVGDLEHHAQPETEAGDPA